MLSYFPVYSFFRTLQSHNGFDLGIGEYNLLMSILSEDKEMTYLSDKAKMLKLCRLLWLKPNENSSLFDKLFEQNFANIPSDIPETYDEQDENAINPKEPEKGIKTPEKGKAAQSEDKKETSTTPSETNKTNDIDKIPTLYLNFEEGQGDNGRSSDDRAYKKNFTFIKNLTPFKQRELTLAWRYFNIKIEDNSFSQSIDINKTIDNYVQQGYLLKPTYKQKMKNKATLITLVDHRGSMVAFKNVALDIINAAQENNINNKVYFFKNLPQKYLSGDDKDLMYVYENQGSTYHKSLKRILAESPDASILIVSDAGTARGEYNINRIEATEEFLTKLYQETTKIAWLNPMPEDRWDLSSAYIIREMVDMFEANKDGLLKAINVLRGKTKPQSAILFSEE